MRQEGFIHQTKEAENDNSNSHAEAVAFVDHHRDFFEHYARGKVSFKPAPPGLTTFAFDLKSNDIYVNSMFYKKRGFSDEKTSFATCHEIEHFEEKKQMIMENGGEGAFSAYVDRIKGDQAFGLLDNCVADIRQNRSVVSKTNEAFRDLEQDLYRNDLFKDTDFTKTPKHIQFAQALLREARVPDEECTVAPEVREELIRIYAMKGQDGTGLLDAMTHPDTPMSIRLKLQDKFLWPIVEKLREEDIEENKQKSQEKADQDQQKSQETSTDPNEVFAEDYKQAGEKVMNAVPIEKQEEAMREWRPSANPLEQADQKYAEKLNVRKEDLQNYRRIAASMEDVINPATSERVAGELRTLFERVISKRHKPQPAPRYPMEEGEDLVDPGLLIADVKAGNLYPKVWETTELQERPKARFGEVEITLIFDRTGSMKIDSNGEKLHEQQKAAVLAMEAMKDFSDRADEASAHMDKPLEIKSEIYAFSASEKDATPLKSMGRGIGERERIDIAKTLATAPGKTTNDYTPLESISKNITSEIEQKMRDGELKKIAIVFTDGKSSDAERVQKGLKELRDKGVVVIGIGITESGKPALDTYAPQATLAQRATDLPRVLADILKEHLAEV